jgi:hypothetical protein
MQKTPACFFRNVTGCCSTSRLLSKKAGGRLSSYSAMIFIYWSLDFIYWGIKISLPIQKYKKIFPKISSLDIVPVISPK